MIRLSLKGRGCAAIRLLVLLAAWMVSPPAGAQPADDPADPGEGRWIVRVKEGKDGKGAARRAGAAYLRPVKGMKGYHLVTFENPSKARSNRKEWKENSRRQLKAQPEFLLVESDEGRIRVPKAFNPSDPLFHDQWHLENLGQTGGLPFSDLNVRTAWDAGLDGEGVTIAIVDTGIQYNHPDLYGNWLNGSGYDFISDDSNPSPTSFIDRHGCAVAGISLALSNSIGGLGIAHKARLLPLRLIPSDSTTTVPPSSEVEALSYHQMIPSISIYNNSWGPSDDLGVRYSTPSTTLRNTFRSGTQNGRGGKGVIYVWAAGNGALNGDNSNYDFYNTQPYTISVGAVGQGDVRETYSEPGANLLVSAPSGGIVTTDNTGLSGYDDGDYYDGFNGTSAAAPMVTGVVALMLQQRPSLNWRDVQQILARTAVPVDFPDRDWSQNGAGLWVSHFYGFGRVDAGAAVSLAADWSSLPAMQTASGQDNRGVTLPFGTTRQGQINISTDLEVQFVEVTVSLSHSDWGDLRIELVSPSGTRSVLSEPHANANDSYEPGTWTYLSTRHLGESSQGNWRLEVTDDDTGGNGSWTSWRLNITGHAVSANANRAPVAGDLVIESTRFPIEVNSLAGVNDPDGDPVRVISVQQPRYGELQSLGKGRYSYTMGETKDGSDLFSVLLSDGKGAVKRRLVRILDPRPVGRNDLFVVQSGETVDLPVLSNDLDPDGDPLRLLAVDGSFPGQAEVLANGIRYSPPEEFTGVARISYQLTDDSDGQSTGWATIVVQDNPDVALQFDGVDDYLRLPPTSSVGMTDNFTAEAWIYPETYGEYVTGFGRIFDRGTFVFFLNGFDHGFYNDQSLVVYLITNDGISHAINTGTSTLKLNIWQHVAVSYKSSDINPVRIYINGRPMAVSYVPEVNLDPPTRPIASNSDSFLYMGESDTGARAFKGKMTEFRVWNRAMTDFAIQSNSDRRLTGQEFGVVLYLPLNRSFEPYAPSAGSYTGEAEIYEAQRVPLEIPWEAFVNHFNLLDDYRNGWWEDRILGAVYGDRYPWIYTESLKWMYAGHPEGTLEYVLYPAASNWGWLYTGFGKYPWFYRYSTDSWLWHFPQPVGPGWYYDFGLPGWVTGDSGIP